MGRYTDEWNQQNENSIEDTEPYYGEEMENGGYYTEESEDGMYYAEDGEYYAEETEDGVYYAEDGEYYAEETEDGVYYAEDGEYYAEETEDGVYYVEEPEDGVYYTDEAWYEEMIAAAPPARKTHVKRSGNGGRKKSGLMLLWMKFLEMGAMDRMITVTGIAVLILALITGGVYLGSRAIDNRMPEFADVGRQLEGIELIGEKGLLAVADAEIARQAAAEIVEEEEEEHAGYDEEEYSNEVTVKLNMTSVKKDLKIKFTNKSTGKLIANVPFSVTVTKPDGMSETWSDEDMDGIIYQKGIKDGTYKVLVNELAGEKYKSYILPGEVQSVEVKKDIAYEKIDVSDEVKTEDEIDVSKEDTQLNGTEVESVLKDTVEWVESTAITATYTEVSKNTIPDPLTLAMSKRFLFTAGVSGGDSGNSGNAAFTLSLKPGKVSVEIGDTVKAKATVTGATKGKALSYTVSSDDTDVATATIDQVGNVTVTGVDEGEATVTVTVKYTKGAPRTKTAKLKVTVADGPKVDLEETTATVYLSEPLVLEVELSNTSSKAKLTAESSDTGVATVAVSDEEITITGVKEGDATITVKCADGDWEGKATCTIKVMKHPKENKTDLLKDADDEQLYVYENNKYREAVYADYYTASKFFIKGEVKYTGWQTIDGEVYFFTASGEKVTGEQVIQGAKYNFASDGSLITGDGTLGIDVSKWNGTIDWKAVKNSGISYVIIRCGYRGSSQGMLVEDPKFKENIKGAINAGLKVGVYFFSQAVDEVEAVEEASFVLDQIKNYKISYPVFLDVEPSGGRGDAVDMSTRTLVCKTFCETIQREGYTAGIYANKTWLNEKIETASLSAYKIWLAQYAATPTYTGRYDMWQYTSTGKVSGISGDVDLNLSYLGY